VQAFSGTIKIVSEGPSCHSRIRESVQPCCGRLINKL